MELLYLQNKGILSLDNLLKLMKSMMLTSKITVMMPSSGTLVTEDTELTDLLLAMEKET